MIDSSHSTAALNRQLLGIGLVVLVLMAGAAQLPRTFNLINHRILSLQKVRSERFADYFAANSSPSDAVFAWGDNRIPFVTRHPSGVK